MGDAGKLELVKQTLDVLLSRLSRRDTVSAVAYSTQAWLLFGPTSAADRDWILARINQLYPRESTNVAEGLRLGRIEISVQVADALPAWT
jgi:hypothetical protein